MDNRTSSPSGSGPFVDSSHGAAPHSEAASSVDARVVVVLGRRRRLEVFVTVDSARGPGLAMRGTTARAREVVNMIRVRSFVRSFVRSDTMRARVRVSRRASRAIRSFVHSSHGDAARSTRAARGVTRPRRARSSVARLEHPRGLSVGRAIGLAATSSSSSSTSKDYKKISTQRHVVVVVVAG